MTLILDRKEDLKKLKFQIYFYNQGKIVWSNEPLRKLVYHLNGKKVKFSSKVDLKKTRILFEFRFGFPIQITDIKIVAFLDQKKIYSRNYPMPQSLYLYAHDKLELTWELK